MGLIPCRENVAEVHLVAQNAVRDILRQINCLPIDRHGKPIVGARDNRERIGYVVAVRRAARQIFGNQACIAFIDFDIRRFALRDRVRNNGLSGSGFSLFSRRLRGRLRIGAFGIGRCIRRRARR